MSEKSVETLVSEYLAIIHRLRKECPWDREQTHESLRSHLLEEAYEAVEAISSKNAGLLRNELGDILLHIVLQSEIAAEENAFTFSDVLSHSAEKMIRRHPHVFGSTTVGGTADVKKNWESIKRQEGKTSILDGVPSELPALIRAQRTQEKASIIGFDWKEKSDVWNKVEEELAELQRAEQSGGKESIEQEFGDLLFALVNYSRFLRVNPEFALRKSVDKFGKRFQFIEEELKRRGRNPSESTFEELDALWNEAKKKTG